MTLTIETTPDPVTMTIRIPSCDYCGITENLISGHICRDCDLIRDWHNSHRTKSGGTRGLAYDLDPLTRGRCQYCLEPAAKDYDFNCDRHAAETRNILLAR
jgi:hypothetical protein